MPAVKKLPLESAGETNVGRKRNHNEDNFAVVEEENLFIVADGMGGHACGEVASQMAVEIVRDFFKATSEDPDSTWPYKMDKSRKYEENRLITGIKLANLRIHEGAQRDARRRGMGTTIVSALFTEEMLYLAHVGDSRIYRVREGTIQQLTEDHSLLNDYIKMKKLTDEEIANFPHKNVIVRALGMKETVKVDTYLEVPQKNDIYLLCSDGLSGMVPDPEALQLVEKNKDKLLNITKSLIESANEHGGVDNITVVLIKWLGY